MPVLLYGMEAWKKLSRVEIQQLEKIQGEALKNIQSTIKNTFHSANK